ncbi:MAG: DUF192 domain-containing protein [candidate division WOR-3 bacterium]
MNLVALCINAETLYVEIADEPYELQRGLMYRDTLPENQGMLFIFPYPQRLSFWMKNTYIPLSIAYISSDWKILEIYDMEPLNEKPIISKNRVQYALEVNRGWFKKRGIKIGDRVKFPCE